MEVFYQLLSGEYRFQTLNRCKKVSVEFSDLFPCIELHAKKPSATFL